jgi:hypothetical protein
MPQDVAAHRPRIAVHHPEQHVEHILHSFLVDMDDVALARSLDTGEVTLDILEVFLDFVTSHNIIFYTILL